MTSPVQKSSALYPVLFRPLGGQRGIALAVSLTFLLMLTLLAVISMNSGTIQQKMAGNTRDMDIAFQSAESALRDGELRLSEANTAAAVAGLSSPAALGISNGIWSFGSVNWTSSSWWSTNSKSYRDDSVKQIEEAYEDPRSAIEYLGPAEGIEGLGCRDDANVATSSGESGCKHYRVTARGVGISGTSEAVTESFYRFHKDQL